MKRRHERSKPPPRPVSTAAGARNRATELFAVFTLVATALVISWPILTGGYLTYADNAAHFAEIDALAFENGGGWSDIAFCGFPVGTLHSPLWYGALAALVYLGAPGGVLYALVLFLGFVAPPIALYAVARRFVRPLAAAFLGYLLLVQRPSVVGLGTPLAGMWTYFVAAAFFILLVGRLGGQCRSSRDLVWVGTLVGLILITHLFLVVPLAVLAAVHLVRSVLGRVSPKTLVLQGVFALVGVVAAAAYWVPLVLASESTTFSPQNLAPPMALARLLLPTDIVELVKGEAPKFTPRLVLEAIPMWTLVGLGAWGSWGWRRRKHYASLYGLVVAVLLLILVVFVAPATNTRVLGPVSWRLLYFVRIGLALGTIPVLAVVESRASSVSRSFWAGLSRRPVMGALAAVGIVLGVWWGAPLRAETPASTSDEMAEVQQLWDWLSENRGSDWGRAYIQDTFMTPPLGAELGDSHILALTTRETGVRQLGAYYGVVPYKTKVWTMGQVGLLYGLRVRGAGEFDELGERMRMTNATHVVVADPALGSQLEMSDAFQLLSRVGRFSVFHLKGATSQWVVPIQGDAVVSVEQYRTGAIRFRVSQNPKGVTVLVKSSYHPFWRLAASGEAQIGEGPTGLIQVKWLPPGDHRIELSYVPPVWPKWLSVVGWLALASMGQSILGRRVFRGSAGG